MPSGKRLGGLGGFRCVICLAKMQGSNACDLTEERPTGEIPRQMLNLVVLQGARPQAFASCFRSS